MAGRRGKGGAGGRRGSLPNQGVGVGLSSLPGMQGGAGKFVARFALVGGGNRAGAATAGGGVPISFGWVAAPEGLDNDPGAEITG
jgi:hypothetical protein